jgi:hypothetical protein
MLALAALLALAAPAAPLPAEIQGHYRDHNFVSAFSTPDERREIVARRQPTDLERLKRVAGAMGRLADTVAEIDRGMVYSLGNGPMDQAMRQDLLRVVSFEQDEPAGEIWVYLQSLRLDRVGQTALVALYDDLTAKDRQPDVDQLVAASGAAPVVTFVMHRWRRTGGGWLRDRATQKLLASRD